MLIVFQAIHLNLTNRKITSKMRDIRSLLNGILLIMEPQDQEKTNNLLTGASTSTPKRQIRGIYLSGIYLLNLEKISLAFENPTFDSTSSHISQSLEALGDLPLYGPQSPKSIPFGE